MVTNPSYSKPFTQEPFTYKTNIFVRKYRQSKYFWKDVSVFLTLFLETSTTIYSNCGLHLYSTLYLLWDECVHQQQFHSYELAGVSEQRWEVEVLTKYCGKSGTFLLLYVHFSYFSPLYCLFLVSAQFQQTVVLFAICLGALSCFNYPG